MTERKKSRQDEVYATAAKLFATRGYHATRMQDIADELGMLKGSLYYYFDSKEDLIVKITSGRIEELYDAIQAIVDTGHTPTQKLTLAIDEHIRFFQDHVHIYTIFVREQLANINDGTANSADVMNKQYQNLFRQILQAGIDAGEFSADIDTQIVMRAILGMCNYTWSWYDPDGRIPVRELARMFTQMVLKGISS